MKEWTHCIKRHLLTTNIAERVFWSVNCAFVGSNTILGSTLAEKNWPHNVYTFSQIWSYNRYQRFSMSILADVERCDESAPTTPSPS